MVLMSVMLLVVTAPALAQVLPAEPLPPPPNCEEGQMQAFTNSLEKRLNDPKTENHLFKYTDCVEGKLRARVKPPSRHLSE